VVANDQIPPLPVAVETGMHRRRSSSSRMLPLRHPMSAA
jgi:hypothetical protein